MTIEEIQAEIRKLQHEARPILGSGYLFVTASIWDDQVGVHIHTIGDGIPGKGETFQEAFADARAKLAEKDPRANDAWFQVPAEQPA